MSNGNGTDWSDEWIRFGVLTVVMIGVVLVVAISRPLIFEHIIPVILGEGFLLPQAELEPPVRLTPEGAEPTDLDKEAVEAENAENGVVDVEPAKGEEMPAPTDAETQAAEGDASVTGEESPAAQEEDAVAVDSAEPVTHIVRTGETLTSIAQQYNVTVSELVAANGLTTPNRIRIGDRLIIP